MNNLVFYISIIGYFLSAVCLIAGIVIFFRLNILYVIKDLNGTIEQKEIAELRKRSRTEKNNRIKIYDPDRTGGKHTGRARLTKETAQQRDENIGDTGMKTSVLQFNRVITKDFVIVTDIEYINTNETI